MITATAQTRYTAPGVTIQKASLNWAAGPFALEDLPEDLTSDRWIGLGQPNGPRRRGVSVQFIGAAEQTAYTCMLWGRRLRRLLTTAGTDAEIELVPLLASAITVTPGTDTGSEAGLVVGPTELVCDTISAPTAAAWLAAFIGGTGTEVPFVHSPADNTVANLWLPEVGDIDGFAIEFAGTGANGATALIQTTG